MAARMLACASSRHRSSKRKHGEKRHGGQHKARDDSMAATSVGVA